MAKSKIKVLANSVLGEGPLPGLHSAVLNPHIVENRERSALAFFFYKSTNAMYDESATLMT